MLKKMSIQFVVFSVVGMHALAATAYEGNRSPDRTLPLLSTAIAEDGRDVPLPLAVRDKIIEYTLKRFDSTYYETLEPKKVIDLFGDVRRWEMPHGSQFHLYSYVCRTTIMYSSTAYFVYNSQTGQVSSRPVSVSNSDLYLLRGPRFSFEDLNLDGRPEFVTHEPDHFGTQANEIHDTYWYIDEILSLLPILRIKTYESTAYPVPGVWERDRMRSYYCFISSVEAIDPNTIVVTTCRALDDDERSPEEVIGNVTFKMDLPIYGYEPVDELILMKELEEKMQRENKLRYVYVCTDPFCMYTNHQEIFAGKRSTCSYCGQQMQLSGRAVR